MHIGAPRRRLGRCKAGCGRPLWVTLRVPGGRSGGLCECRPAALGWPRRVPASRSESASASAGRPLRVGLGECRPAVPRRGASDSNNFLGVAGSEETLRVVIADDHHFFRDGLRGILQDAGIEVVGEAADGEEAVALVARLAPDLAMLDLNMPGLSGIEALGELARVAPEVQGVILTVSTEEADVLAALAAGACGYLLKDMRPDRLVAGVRRAAEGDLVLAADVAKALRGYVRAGAESAAGVAAAELHSKPERVALTPREAEVLRLIVEGADNAAIGEVLSISPHTVKQYVANIFEKLGVRSRVQAAVHAVREGLV
jgi:DNA-binding NarL/FixJ family response regulator